MEKVEDSGRAFLPAQRLDELVVRLESRSVGQFGSISIDRVLQKFDIGSAPALLGHLPT